MCQTAIKAVIFLYSQKDEQHYTGIRKIAAAIDCSEHTVGKLLQLLVKNKIIGSIKGPSGGFFITPKQGQLPVITIVEAIDGREKFTECGLGLAKCSKDHPCPIHFQYGPIREELEKIFRERKVADLCQTVDNGESYLAG